MKTIVAIKRGEVISNAYVSLVAETCPACNCWHAIPQDLYRRAKEDSEVYIICPYGHSWHYTVTLREELRGAKIRARNAEGRIVSLKDQCEAAERSKAGYKGALTKTKNRIANGVCPCCKRHFSNLENHMKTKHPLYAGNNQ